MNNKKEPFIILLIVKMVDFFTRVHFFLFPWWGRLKRVDSVSNDRFSTSTQNARTSDDSDEEEDESLIAQYEKDVSDYAEQEEVRLSALGLDRSDFSDIDDFTAFLKEKLGCESFSGTLTGRSTGVTGSIMHKLLTYKKKVDLEQFFAYKAMPDLVSVIMSSGDIDLESYLLGRVFLPHGQAFGFSEVVRKAELKHQLTSQTKKLLLAMAVDRSYVESLSEDQKKNISALDVVRQSCKKTLQRHPHIALKLTSLFAMTKFKAV